MYLQRVIYYAALAFICVLSSVSFHAHASLGDGEATIEQDRQSFNGVRKMKNQIGFSVHEITTPGGLTVKEFMGPDGTIFGVSWRGPTHPDLQVLLGKYHGEYKAADNAKPKRYGHGHETLKTLNMVVEHGGHMRDVRGRAFVPSLFPKGVTEADIQ